jgi:hypothetical protein
MTLAAPDDLETQEEDTAGTVRIGPVRNPDACVLACSDCACRRRLDEHRALCANDEHELPVPVNTTASNDASK